MTNTSESDFLHHTVNPLYMTVWVCITGFLLALATVCNACNLLCLVFFAHSGRPTTGHVLLGVLFFNDLFSSAIFYPAITSNIAQGNTGLWHRRWFCQLMSFGGTVTALCSSSSTTQIAIFRVFMAVHRRCPPYKIEAQKKRFAAFLVVFTYFASCVVPAFSYIPQGNREIDPPYGFCGLEPYKQEPAIQWVKLAIWVFLPTVITAVCYWRIHVILTHMNSENQLRSMSRLRCLSIRILWMVMLKIVAHFPVAMFYLLRDDESPRPTANLAVLSIHFASTIFNSVLYGFTDPQMTLPYRNMLGHLRSSGLWRFCERWLVLSRWLVANSSERAPLRARKTLPPVDSDPSECEIPPRPLSLRDSSCVSSTMLGSTQKDEIDCDSLLVYEQQDF